MKTSTMISFRNVPSTTEVFSAVERRADHIRHLHRGVESCRVSLDRTARRHRHGNPLRVAVEVHAAGAWLVARATRRDSDSVGAVAAVNEAFGAVEKQLRTRLSRQRDARSSGAEEESYDLVS